MAKPSNFYRLVSFMLEICTPVLNKLLVTLAKTEPGHTYTTMESYLIHVKTLIQRIHDIRNDQLSKLYPSPGRVDESALDISLLSSLLLGLFKNGPSGPIDEGAKRAMIEIRRQRNILQHKRHPTDVDDNEFKLVWTNLENATLTVAKVGGDDEYKDEIKSRIDDLVTNSRLPGLPENLTSWFMDIIGSLQTQIDAVKQDTSVIHDVKEDTAVIRQNTDIVLELMPADAGSGVKRGVKRKCETDGGSPAKIKIVASRKLEKRTSDTHEPWFTDMVFISNDRLVVLDRKNKTLQVFNEVLKVINRFKFNKSRPIFGLGVLSENKVVLSRNGEVLIIKIKQNGSIEKYNSISTSATYTRLCPLSNSKFMVCKYKSTPVVSILILSENECEEVEFEDDIFPEGEYTADTCNVGYTQESDNIVFTDRAENEIYISNNDVKIVIENDGIQQPGGVCAGPGGSMFVCCGGTDSLVHISPDREIIGYHKLSLKLPYAIAVDPAGKTMAISNSAPGEKLLQLYRIA